MVALAVCAIVAATGHTATGSQAPPLASGHDTPPADPGLQRGNAFQPTEQQEHHHRGDGGGEREPGQPALATSGAGWRSGCPPPRRAIRPAADSVRSAPAARSVRRTVPPRGQGAAVCLRTAANPDTRTIQETMRPISVAPHNPLLDRRPVPADSPGRHRRRRRASMNHPRRDPDATVKQQVSRTSPRISAGSLLMTANNRQSAPGSRRGQ